MYADVVTAALPGLPRSRRDMLQCSRPGPDRYGIAAETTEISHRKPPPLNVSILAAVVNSYPVD
jgi:hypothetical protein